MRSTPEDKYDNKELAKLNAADWMVDALKMNPSYVWWGPYEDYMCGDDKGWESRSILEKWEDNNFDLDDLNEVVNFYFEIERATVNCDHCEQSGLNPASKKISDDWYAFENPQERWSHDITQDEVQALVDGNRLYDFTHTWDKENGWVRREDGYVPTAKEVNDWSRKGMGHDSINHWICSEQRAKRLGVYGQCKHCDGQGFTYTEPHAKLGLVLWVLHPRKGCSKGVHIKHIEQDKLPKAVEYLKEAMQRNADRFSGLLK